MKNQKGITLIALIITIIVLLILAGVSISLVVGDNGILSQAGKAKTETDIAEEREFAETAYSSASIEKYGNGAQIDKVQSEIDKLAGEGKAQVTQNEDGTFNIKYIDSGRTYIVGKILNKNVVNWNNVLEEANQNPGKYKYSEDTTSGYIAIGTDGKPVNMELWNPTLNEDETTWLLGSIENYYTSTDAYKGEITTDGKIVGCVPQYIYNETKGEFTAVTKMRSTFCSKSNLKIAPDIPNTVTDMFACFAVCTLLERVSELPENLINMHYTFYMCKILENAPQIPNTVQDMTMAFNECEKLKSISISNGITNISYAAFCNCSSLTNITIPSSVTNIEDLAFENCSELTSIIVDEDNITYDSRENCNAIIETSTNTLVVGGKNTIIPNSIVSIGDRAFWGCRGLIDIDIPSNVVSIGGFAFHGCTGLTNLTIAEGVNDIGYQAFWGCSSLTSVIIPESVSEIGVQAFGWCNNLSKVYFKQTTTPTFWSKCFEKSSNPVTTFYFKNSTVADAFTTSYYNSSYGTKSTNYSW